MRYAVSVALAALVAAGSMLADPAANAPKALSPLEADLLRHIDAIETELVQINQDIWTYAELGLQEYRSAARLIGVLKKAGFRVREGVSHMPTAFVAEYGEGKPIIGILAEYDALPDLSQEATGQRKPIVGQGAGHGCGHCALGTAAVGAALAVRSAYEKHGLKGTIRVYGTPAEETAIGKVYMTLDGQFNDLDACLHWHPGTKNRVEYGSTKAVISAKFTFTGLAAHAAGSPDKGRSALDGVELMNVGVNYMREHVKETTRVHHVITQGGGQPNVVPASAQVWYYVRANTHEDVERVFDWVCDIAEAAAKMSRTKVQIAIDTDCHEIIPNLPLSQRLYQHFLKVGPPRFDDADRELARQLQAPLRTEFGLKEEAPLLETIEELPAQPYLPEGGSTDVGDVSWHVPTTGLTTVCFANGSPGHSWQNVAAIGSPIGHKGMLVAAKVLALGAADLLQDATLRDQAKADLQQRLKDRPYTTRVPKGQQAPRSIR
ncbi:MAG: amidohydrolase [Gemmataceae bacterium]|nr:amidohydrolase [Gemmataceae bacterium]MDW8264163.1 amidohydrolase [Gemmataceae bacterium]